MGELGLCSLYEVQLQGKVKQAADLVAWLRMLSRDPVHLKGGLICAEWVMRGPFVEREIFSMFVESHTRGLSLATKQIGFP